MANLEPFKTADAIINRAAILCSLAPVTDTFASPDPNFILLRALLDLSGQSLAREHPWTQLQREYEMVTTGAEVYALPSDFNAMLNQTQWVVNGIGGAQPLAGPATPQQWSQLVSSADPTAGIYLWFRPQEGKLRVFPIEAGTPIRFEYMSRAWVVAADDSTTRRDHALLPSDMVLYEPLLIEQRLRLEFLQARGFDTTKAKDDYLQIYSSIAGQDGGAPVLSMSADGAYGGHNRLVGWRNTPDSGYGT